ncbi:sulfite exporter TauE/SafE family protein [Vibrio sp. IRLE0018]|uniref:sulfite exporter TauE/SafE family protein n=1 Tax=Vibrio TaxID=662 RepID=UPI00159353FF|nr:MULTISPECIES: sulfite exporter TauE/SafE family protein [Vibrio]MCF8779970.1 sulfite exporter TauE/SafE family protein [Vibrio floridensis]NVC63925.1 sulfite exporter TauE/SafE family protein [Vibrio sp. 05-20-BW147]HAS6349424.1 sulfite exporter TauE/SafE family protein [Vibrio vulnificus]
MTPDFIGAFMIGLAGAGHCIGMCGGIASLLNLGQQQASPIRNTLLYNLGRLTSYALFGGLIGGAVSSLTELSGLNHSLAWLRLIAASFMILVALYISKLWSALLTVEKGGQFIWRWIKPVTAHLLPIKHPLQALPYGFVWGWLPCGLVYSALTWSAVSGGFINGSLIMLAFGLGTLPAMILVGFGAQFVTRLQSSLTFRHITAFSLFAYGVYTAYEALKLLQLVN